MSGNNRIECGFTWIPMDKRKGRFGPLPPRKPETRKPLFWLSRKDNDLYFVNNSEETLDVVAGHSESVTNWDGWAELHADYKNRRIYRNVKPQEAVKIDEFDPVDDLDWVIGEAIRVRSQKQGHILIRTLPKRGGIDETVLLWDTGEKGSYVSIEKHEPPDAYSPPDRSSYSGN